MAVGRGFFDQYSVFCVFGSVVGCVVVPLITQSVESVIFSAIVISLTATHLTKRATKTENSNQVNTKEIEKRASRKLKDREPPAHIKKKKLIVPQAQQLPVKTTDDRRKKEGDQKKLDIAKQLEWERKQEEKKERKVKKKEERSKRKEHEREEKEKEEQRLKEYKEQRQKEMKENLKFSDKNSAVLQRADSGKTRLSSTSKSAKKLDPSAAPRSPYKVPGSPVLTTQCLARQRSQSEGSESEPPSPPPSVWKVPEYVEPEWNPGKPDLEKCSKEETRLNNDVVCAKVKPQPPFNQLHNPVYNSQSFKKNQFMNQNPEKIATSREAVAAPPSQAHFSLVKDMDKPDNRQVKFNTYSSFSGLDLLSQLKEENKTPDADVRSYSLFGPDEPNSTLFKSPLTGH